MHGAAKDDGDYDEEGTSNSMMIIVMMTGCIDNGGFASLGGRLELMGSSDGVTKWGRVNMIFGGDNDYIDDDEYGDYYGNGDNDASIATVPLVNC